VRCRGDEAIGEQRCCPGYWLLSCPGFPRAIHGCGTRTHFGIPMALEFDHNLDYVVFGWISFNQVFALGDKARATVLEPNGYCIPVLLHVDLAACRNGPSENMDQVIVEHELRSRRDLTKRRTSKHENQHQDPHTHTPVRIVVAVRARSRNSLSPFSTSGQVQFAPCSTKKRLWAARMRACETPRFSRQGPGKKKGRSLRIGLFGRRLVSKSREPTATSWWWRR